MQLPRRWVAGLICASALAYCGCVVPKSELTALETRSRVLAEQNRAQVDEIENLKAHVRNRDEQLLRAERQLSALQDREKAYLRR